ncbi:MAG: DUF6982 domain-containing protein [Nitrospirota bacterium]
MQNRIVLHFGDGRIVKGSTGDFFPDKQWFHVTENGTGTANRVDVAKLKGVFFVKDYDGNPDYESTYDVERKGLGRKVKVSFKDGESVIGYTSGFSPSKPGFFLFPADPNGNTEKIFVVIMSTEDIRFL